MEDALTRLVERLVREAEPERNPYFRGLADGSFSKDDFVETQIQFHFAVTFFSRPMAALAAKIPFPEQRLEVLRNVWEEHGEGNAPFMHANTFLEFLHRLDGLSRDDVLARALWPEVRLFNTTLVGACVLDEYLVGGALLGMVERLFADISAWIGQAVVERGFLPAERMIHYSLHQTLDRKHCEDFFDVLRPAFSNGGEDRYAIEQGLRLGASVFLGMYEGLWRNRGRRLLADGFGNRGLHTRA